MVNPEDSTPLPPLPIQNQVDWFEPRSSFDEEVKRRLEGYLSPDGLQAILGLPRVSSHQIPSQLEWPTEYRVEPTLEATSGAPLYGSIGATAEGLFDRYSSALANPGATFWVSPTGNNDAAGTFAAPFRSIWRAVQAGNAAGVPTRVNVNAGHYSRSLGFHGGGGTIYPQVDMAFVAAAGRVQVSNSDPIVGFAVDSTHSNTYSKDLANCDRVLDLTDVDEYGHFADLVRVGTASLVNVTPNSFALESGKIYIRRRDGKAPTDVNTQLFRAEASVRLYRPVNIYIGGGPNATGMWDFRGGAAGVLVARIEAGVAPAPGQRNVLVCASASFNYGGEYGGAGVDGVALSRWQGLAAFFNCEASRNNKDGFNAHNDSAGGYASDAPYILLVNCRGYDNGRGLTSSNGLTIHEDYVGIDVAGDYRWGHGGTISNIGASRMYLLGTYVEGDSGDLGSGGGILPAAVKVGDSAKIWAERVAVKMPPAAFGYTTTGAESGIYRRSCPPIPQRDYGNGTFGTF